MQNERLQKIQGLVKTAAVLSVAEKGEWQELMDLMNDRQLLELERILVDADRARTAGASAGLNKPSVMGKMPAPVAAAKPSVPPQPLPTLPKNLPIAKEAGSGPSFKHILNFPQAGGSAVPKSSAPTVPGPVRLESKTTEPKKESVFLSKLKSIFSEKELPPGHIDELSAPKVLTRPPVAAPQKQPGKGPMPVPPRPKQPAATTINIFMDKQKPDKTALANEALAEPQIEEKPKSDYDAPAAAQPPAKPKIDYDTLAAAVKAVMPPVKEQEPKLLNLSLKANQADVSAQNVTMSGPGSEAGAADFRGKTGIAPAPETAAGPAPKPWDREEPGLLNLNKKPAAGAGLAKKPAAAGPAPGLNFTEGPSAASLKSRLMSEPGRPAGGSAAEPAMPAVKIALQEKQGDEIKLETLADIALLKSDTLKQHATGTLFRKFQKLVGQYGQHEVTFRLEQSPLYKAYINTGVAWLKDGSRKASVGDQQLAAEDFEHFADFLIMLRSRA